MSPVQSRPVTPSGPNTATLPIRTPSQRIQPPIDLTDLTSPASNRTNSPIRSPAVDRNESSRDREPLPQYDLRQSFKSYDEAYNAYNSLALEQGFQVVISKSARSKAKGGGYDPEGFVRYYQFTCDKSGKHRIQGHGDRQRGTRLCSCPHKATITHQKRQDCWIVKIIEASHNHELGNNAASANYRRAQRNSHDLKTAILRLLRTGSLTASQIANFLSGSNLKFDQLEPHIQFGLEADPDDPLDSNQGSDELYNSIRQQNITVTPNDVANIKADLKKKLKGELTDTQLLIKKLQRYKEAYGIDYEVDINPVTKRVTRLFWTFKWCLHMWQRNPEVLLFDNTYKVNRFNMPLLNITGITSLHTNFHVAFSLASGEAEADFTWQLGCLNRLRAQHEIREPTVILSDFSRAFKRAASLAFASSPQQLCVWHIMKNVAHHITKKWIKSTATASDLLLEADEKHAIDDRTALSDDQPGPDPPSYKGPTSDEADEADEDPEEAKDSLKADQNTVDIRAETLPLQPQKPAFDIKEWPDNQDGFMKAWKAVVYADTEEIFWTTWALLKKRYQRQIPLINYLIQYYLPWRNQYCQFAVSQIRNYGTIATSRLEAAHRHLKRYIKHRHCSLEILHTEIYNACADHKATYELGVQKAKSQSLPKYRQVGIFRNVLHRISPEALKQIWRQYRLAHRDYLAWRNSDISQSACKGLFTKQWDLPCKHVFFDLLRAERDRLNPARPWALEMTDIGRHWWLHFDGSLNLTEEEAKDFEIQDPKPLEGRKRREAHPEGLPLEALQKNLDEIAFIDPERHESNPAPGPRNQPSRQVDYDSRRIQSHDEAPASSARPTQRRRGRKTKADQQEAVITDLTTLIQNQQNQLNTMSQQITALVTAPAQPPQQQYTQQYTIPSSPALAPARPGITPSLHGLQGLQGQLQGLQGYQQWSPGPSQQGQQPVIQRQQAPVVPSQRPAGQPNQWQNQYSQSNQQPWSPYHYPN